MPICYLCRKEERMFYFGYFCKDCKNIQNLMNIYSPNVVWDLNDKALKVQENAMDRKVATSISKVIKNASPKYNTRAQTSNPLV